MFGELLKDIQNSVSEMRHGTATRTITVAKPYCAPCRDSVMTALQPYGLKIYGYSEGARVVNPLTVLKVDARLLGDTEGGFLPPVLPTAQVAKVTVSEAAAAWAEYLLMRSNLYVVPPYINRRNEQWAARHGGQMPPQWDKGQPWIESSCSKGIQQWQAVKDAAKQGQKPVSGRQSGRKLTGRW